MTKRLNLVLSDKMAERLKKAADERDMPIQQLIKTFCLIGMEGLDTNWAVQRGLIIGRGGVERFVYFLSPNVDTSWRREEPQDE